MPNKINISTGKQEFIVYVVLAIIALAVFWQANQYDFVFDDFVYVADNSHVQSGMTLDGIRWAFGSKYFGLWNPLVWLSLILDHEIYGLNAGGYHVTNLILHILGTLLLFGLFCRMTNEIWRSAFVAAFFALHPLHVESVAWISERKDVLSAFFWMLTLCLYVYYTQKPALKRYLLVLSSFVLALMSKPMVITLPLIMILLDYWPLSRFRIGIESPSGKVNPVLWQLKEKLPFFVLSAVLVIVTFYTPNVQNTSIEGIPFISRLINAPVAFVTYLAKTFWPHDMAVFYPFPSQIPIWHVFGATFLIIVISTFAIVKARRLPYFFVGWFWYTTTILPVIGIIQIGDFAMADRYHYLPSIGIAIGLAWGIPSLINENIRSKILFPMGMAFFIVLSVLSWKQCSYWKNSITLFSHALSVTKNNYLAHNNLGLFLGTEDKINEALDHYNKAIRIKKDNAMIYTNRGVVFTKTGKYYEAINDFNEAISLKPDYADAYSGRGNVYVKLDQHQIAIEDYNKAIVLNHNDIKAYNNRGVAYYILGQYQQAVEDYNEAIRQKPDYAYAYYNRGNAYYKLGQYQRAIENYNETIRLKPGYVQAYNNRGNVYFLQNEDKPGCRDAQKACELGECKLLKWARGRGLCSD